MFPVKQRNILTCICHRNSRTLYRLEPPPKTSRPANWKTNITLQNNCRHVWLVTQKFHLWPFQILTTSPWYCQVAKKLSLWKKLQIFASNLSKSEDDVKVNVTRNFKGKTFWWTPKWNRKCFIYFFQSFHVLLQEYKTVPSLIFVS